MMTKAEQAQQVKAAMTDLRKVFPKGSTAYTVLTHVSRSGMSRRIMVLAPVMATRHGKRRRIIRDMSYRIADVLHYRVHDSGGLVVGGAGMDMGFAVVYELAQALYGDGYALDQQWV